MSYSCEKHVIKYCVKVYERSGKNLFWSIKTSGEILDTLKARNINTTRLSTYYFSTLYTTLPNNLIKDKLSIAKTYEHNRLDETSIVDRHRCHMAAKFGMFVNEDHSTLPTLYWLP